MYPSIYIEHGGPGRLRPVEDPGHRQLRPCHAGPTQDRKVPLRHEDTG